MTEAAVHTPVAYIEQHLPARRAEEFRVAADGSVTVRICCPECAGVTMRRFPKVFAGAVKGVDPPAVPLAVAVVYCDCGRAHADRPADAPDRGCGAYWELVF